MESALITLTSLLLGWLADRFIGDPTRFPHLIVGIGKLIALGERHLNQGKHRTVKGGLLVILIGGSIPLSIAFLLNNLPPLFQILIGALLVFYCLAGTTLIREVRAVFQALDISLEAGRNQVARIVGRDTDQLTDNECRTAALETLSENLSDGVVAPLFWFSLLGVPGIVLYKIINTFDSMIGYKNERYKSFGCFAAKLDDVANYLPARITAFLMLLVNGRLDLLKNVFREGKKHLSPCSGYPEAALALLLDCQFGGAHNYFGKIVEKPTIGCTPRALTHQDLIYSIHTNRRVEYVAVFLTALPPMFILILSVL